MGNDSCKSYTVIPLHCAIYFKTLGRCLKPQIVPNHVYAIFSYTYVLMIRLNV